MKMPGLFKRLRKKSIESSPSPPLEPAMEQASASKSTSLAQERSPKSLLDVKKKKSIEWM